VNYQTTISEGWTSYLQKVLPIDVGKVQRVETKRAFYAGAWHLLQAFKQMPDALTEEEGVAWLESQAKEITQFYKRVEAGIE
jgi:hypothetical protein